MFNGVHSCRHRIRDLEGFKPSTWPCMREITWEFLNHMYHFGGSQNPKPESLNPKRSHHLGKLDARGGSPSQGFGVRASTWKAVQPPWSRPSHLQAGICLFMVACGLLEILITRTKFWRYLGKIYMVVS